MATGGEVEFSLPLDPTVDDFEVVNGAESSSDLDIVEEELAGEEINGGIDPAETFEMIQAEHSAAKRALEAQRLLLSREIDAKENQIKQNAELKSKVIQLEMAVEERDLKISALESDVKNYRDTSVKSDELVAKLCNSEETVRYYEEMTKRFQNEGFVEVNPHVYTDSVLASDLASKEKELSNLKKLVDDMQSQLVTLEELKKEKDEWKNLAVALEIQLQCDGADLHDLKAQFNEEKSALMAELERLRSGNQTELAQSSPPPATTDHQCGDCFFQATSETELESHQHRCPHNIINFD